MLLDIKQFRKLSKWFDVGVLSEGANMKSKSSVNCLKSLKAQSIAEAGTAVLLKHFKGQLFQPLSELLVCNCYLKSSGAVKVEMYKMPACICVFFSIRWKVICFTYCKWLILGKYNLLLIISRLSSSKPSNILRASGGGVLFAHKCSLIQMDKY